MSKTSIQSDPYSFEDPLFAPLDTREGERDFVNHLVEQFASPEEKAAIEAAEAAQTAEAAEAAQTAQTAQTEEQSVASENADDSVLSED